MGGTKRIGLLMLSISNVLSGNRVVCSTGNVRAGTFSMRSNINIGSLTQCNVLATVVANHDDTVISGHTIRVNIGCIMRKHSSGLVTLGRLLSALSPTLGVATTSYTCVNSSLPSVGTVRAIKFTTAIPGTRTRIVGHDSVIAAHTNNAKTIHRVYSLVLGNRNRCRSFVTRCALSRMRARSGLS